MSHIPFELQESVKRGECVLFVGAGVSEGLPTWKELVRPLADEMGITIQEDPRFIAEYYENEFGRSKLEKKIISRLKKDVPLTRTHEIVAKIPLKAIVTTNYDNLLEKALSEKDYIRILSGREAPLARADQLPLIKMHGDLNSPSTMVITKKDYDEYPERHRALTTYLLGFLISSNFLFVGFGLRDPNFDNIYFQIRSLFRESQRKGFAIFKNPSEFEMKRLKNMGIEVIPIRDYDEIPEIFEGLLAVCGEEIEAKVELIPQKLENIQETFREVVRRQNKWLDPRGIFQFDRMLTRREVKLEEVYVVPRLIKQEIIRKRKEEYIRKRDKSRKRSRVEKRSKEYVTERTVELTVKDVLFSPRNYQVVILGEPGVGKTCLLQYIALIASISAGESVGLRRPLLPVLVPLREYPKYSKGKMLKRFIFDYIRNQICFLPDEVLEHFLENNSFFFLLDGLDEVMDESERIEVSRQVERFMAQYPQTRIVLTSRPAGYRPAALIGTIPHFTLAEFNKDDIRNFLVKWFTFLDKIEKEKFEKEKTEGKAQGLSDIILKREKILRLARNPLLLTILVLIHRVGKKLPERRAEFYDHAVKTIAGSWERWKGLKTNRRLLDQETILGVLEKIGFRLHSEVQENLVEADGLRNWLEESMIEERGCYSKKEINDFLWILNERAGLMVEKGLGLYGFVHLTFQEYFAARYLALGRGVRLIRDLLKENLYSSRWREVFLLSVAIAPPEQANLMLDSVLKIENPFENYIHSNLMFAGSMLADLPRIRSSKRKEVIKGLISLTTSRNIDILRIEALEILSEISRAFPLEDISWALKLLNDKKSDVQEQALKYFTMVGAKDPKLSANFMNYLMTKTGMSVCRR